MSQRQTEQGLVLGKDQGSHYFFGGIPYAAAVTHDTRFKAPCKAPARTEILDCTEFRASAIQGRTGQVLPCGESDNCLFLNIWVPKKASKAAVLVFIHGGGYLGGTGAGYRGTVMCEEQGLVVVTLNYRLSVIGFTNWSSILEDTENHFENNIGILDQLEALKWVHKNIEFFDGDCQNVTLAGESAGAGSAVLLLATPSAHAYFNRCILQSGSLSLIDTLPNSRRKAEVIIRWLCKSVLDGTIVPEGLLIDSAVVQKALESGHYADPHISAIVRACSTQQLHQAVSAGGHERNGWLPYGPWFSGGLFPSDAVTALSQMSPAINLLLGHNRNEAHLWPMTRPRGLPEELPVSATTLEPIINSLPAEDAEKLREIYKLQTENDYVDLCSDLIFVNTTRRVADDLSRRGATIFRYRLDRLCEIGPYAGLAPHAIELLAFWVTPWSRSYKGSDAWMTKDTLKLCALMRRSWGDFIREGKISDWPQYTHSEPRVKIFDVSHQPSLSYVVNILPGEAEKAQLWQPHELP